MQISSPAQRLTIAVLIGAPLWAAWRDPYVAPWFVAASVALLVISAMRPLAGVLVVAAVGPLASWIAVLAGASWGGDGVAEVLILSALAGAFLHPAAADRRHARAFARVCFLFGVVVGTSAIVELAVQQFGTEWLPEFLRTLGYHVVSAYFLDPNAFPPLHTAAKIIEGLLLAVIAARCVARAPEQGLAVLRMIVLGGAAAAACSWYRLAEISVRSAAPWSSLLQYLRAVRISPLYGDVNAAGSYLALVFVPAALMCLRQRRRIQWGAMAVLIGGALLFTSSRAAEASAIVVTAATILWQAWSRWSRRTRVAILAAAVAVTCVIAVWNPGREHQASASAAFDIRTGMAAVALRMAVDHPITGVGIGTFQETSRSYIPAALIRLFPTAARGENAHNNYLQILAELGVIGLASFLWLIVVAAGPARSAGFSAMKPERAAVLGGLAAFLATCLLGHPLLTPQVAWVFFLCLGLSAGLAAGAGDGTPGESAARSRWPRRIVAVGAAGLILTVPLRANHAIRHAQLDHYFIGASAPAGTLDDVPYRIADPRSAWFIDARSRIVELPLRLAAASSAPCVAAITLDKKPADTVAVSAAAWQRVRIQVPPDPDGRSTRVIGVRIPEGCQLLVGNLEER